MKKVNVKKILVSVMAVMTIASGAMGMTASAYAPTVTGTFNVGSAKANVSGYCDSSQAVARTTISGAKSIETRITAISGKESKRQYKGSVATNYVECKVLGTSLKNAKSYHAASKKISGTTYSGSRTLGFY